MVGNFGENLTVEGLADNDICIGDRFRIRSTVAEVSQPRDTCYRAGIRLNRPKILHCGFRTIGLAVISAPAETNVILGAAFLNMGGAKVICCEPDRLYATTPYTALLRATHIHPTVAQFLPRILDDLAPMRC